MHNVSMSGTNYPGKIADMNTNIKQFYSGSSSSSSSSPWVYKNNRAAVQTTVPCNVIASKDLIVANNIFLGGSIYTPSDESLKNIITNVQNGNDICALNPIVFTYNQDASQLPHYGFLAQEVEQVYPSLVDSFQADYKHINYQEMIPLMIAKMKSMQQEIDALKSRIN